MLVSLLTISIIGLGVGFIFSVPVAGPISIMITSHALRGEGRYCLRVAFGAAIIDFLYCFIGVFGFTHLYLRYERVIPYLLTAGSLLIFYYGVKILRTRLDMEHLEIAGTVKTRLAMVEQKGGFRAGLALNFLNPSLFIGWMTSSFIVISLVASLGFNVGTLNAVLSSDMETIRDNSQHNSGDTGIELPGDPLQEHAPTESGPDAAMPHTLPRLVHSLAYAFFVGVGTIVWFYYFSRFLIRHRQKLNIHALTRIIQILGVLLCFLSVYLIYAGIRMFLTV